MKNKISSLKAIILILGTSTMLLQSCNIPSRSEVIKAHIDSVEKEYQEYLDTYTNIKIIYPDSNGLFEACTLPKIPGDWDMIITCPKDVVRCDTDNDLTFLFSSTKEKKGVIIIKYISRKLKESYRSPCPEDHLGRI